MENFFEEPLLGRQEQKSLREQEKERIWDIFQRDYEETPVETALESLRSIVIHMRLILEQQMGIFYIRSYRWIWKYEELQ